MPIGKISTNSGKGADYTAGSTNLQHNASQSKLIVVSRPLFYQILPLALAGGGKTVTGYQKTTSQHSFGAGAVNIEAATTVPKVKENLGYNKSELSGTSSYGAGAVGIENALNVPKIKNEGLQQVDKKKEMVYEKSLPSE